MDKTETGAPVAASAAVEQALRAAAEEAARSAIDVKRTVWDVASGPLTNRANWERLRQHFILDPAVTHLNAGTIGSVPRPVLDLLGRRDEHYARHPGDPYPETTMNEARQVLAEAYGCDRDELAVVQGATDGNARILNGLELGEGDEVVTTTHECYTMQAPLNLLHNRRGVVVRKLTPRLGHDVRAEEIVEQFEAAITPRTKVLEWAAVTFTTGTTMPTRLLAELAQRHGLITVVDGAHLPGQFAFNLHELGIDFLSGSGSKYQCGPMGTGILYARNKVLPQHNPLPLPAFWPVISLWYPIEGALPPRADGAEPAYDMATFIQKTGTTDLSRAPALRAASEIWQQIGQEHIQRYVFGLCAHIRERVVEHWGRASLFSPYDDARLHSGMVAFQPFRDDALALDLAKFHEFEQRMEEEHGFNLRFTFFPVRGAESESERYAIRLAPHLYNTLEEVDRAVDAMIKLTADMS
ncbi:aminotransferase class V-fold PLP-dependent enzyme [Dactylosporangium sp. CA-139066]|uniref:aminotransferase class V-fold PLP-dependent enzyme n=1 Tax=Dactylosporangium sp. CA-139066 TaxID=3239930 RepID=UPI003D8EB899